MDELARLGAKPRQERYVFDGKYATAAGVSAGIDMALALADRIGGAEMAQRFQLGIEYDPQPPYNAGSPATAPAEIVADLRARSRFAAGAERRADAFRSRGGWRRRGRAGTCPGSPASRTHRCPRVAGPRRE